MDKNHQLPQYIADFIGTFFLVFLGCGAVILSELDSTAINNFAIPLVFGGTVSIMIYSVGHISGAHFNPAVTIAFWAIKRLPGVRVPGYLFAQFLGALIASISHYLIWGKLGHSFGQTILSTGLGAGLFIEFIISFGLMFVITSVATDSRAAGELAGIAIGTTVAVSAFFAGPLTGASMNPARSFAPALMSANFENIWVYLLTPVLGASLGAFVYDRTRCIKESQSSSGCC